MKNKFLLYLIIALSTVLIFGLLYYISIISPNEPDIEPVHTEHVEIPKPTIKYGIVTDSLLLFEGKVRKNENLSTILRQYGVTSLEISEIAKHKDVFDVRRMRYGRPYTVLCNADTTAKYFIYEQSQVDYIVISFSDSLTIYPGKKEVTKVRRIASGFIESSLWNAMLEYDIDPMMSIELSEIYAWNIDFFGLKKGDHFSVIYDEEYVDTVRVGIGEIYSAAFNHRNNDFYAISFEQDSVEDYYDSVGGSLRRTFLKAPLRYSRISSGFSRRRLHPVLKIYRPHTGIDYAAPTGTPVHTVGDGVVIAKKYTAQGGRMVKIKHNSVYTTAYLHLSRYGKDLYVGATVLQGQVIGYVGSSGLATGPHLDFRFWKNGKPINPLKVESPSVEPVKKVNMDEYNLIRDKMIEELKIADEKLHKTHPQLAKFIKVKRAGDTELINMIARYEYRKVKFHHTEKTYVLPDNQEWYLQ